MDIKKASAIVSLILVVLLIGAVVANIGPSQDDEPDDNSTPVDNSPQNNNLDNTDEISILPTGLTEESETLTVNPSLLISSHQRILTNRSMTVVINNNTDPGEKVIQRTNDSVITNESLSGVGTVSYSDSNYTVTNNSLNVLNTSGERLSTSIGRINSNHYTMRNRFQTLLTNMDVSTYELLEDAVRVEFSASSSSDIELAYNLQSLDTARMTAVVDQDGYIRNASISIQGTSQTGIRTVRTQNYTIKNFEDTEVVEPDWVGRAEAQNALVKGTLSRSANYIALEHRGLSTVTTQDTEIRIVELPSFNRTTIDLRRQFREGDVIYLRTTRDGWDISYNQEPAEGDRPINQTVSITGYDFEQNRSVFDVSFEQ